MPREYHREIAEIYLIFMLFSFTTKFLHRYIKFIKSIWLKVLIQAAINFTYLFLIFSLIKPIARSTFSGKITTKLSGCAKSKAVLVALVSSRMTS